MNALPIVAFDGFRVFLRRAETTSACLSTRSTLPLQIFWMSASLKPAFLRPAVILGMAVMSCIPFTPPPPSQSAPSPTWSTPITWIACIIERM